MRRPSRGSLKGRGEFRALAIEVLSHWKEKIVIDRICTHRLVEHISGLFNNCYLVDWKGLKAVRIDPWPHPKLLFSEYFKENLKSELVLWNLNSPGFQWTSAGPMPGETQCHNRNTEETMFGTLQVDGYFRRWHKREGFIRKIKYWTSYNRLVDKNRCFDGEFGGRFHMLTWYPSQHIMSRI